MLGLGYASMLIVGVILGLIGGGGAILTMPILVYLFAINPVLATSYSLFVVGFASVFGVWRYHQQKLVNYSVAVIFVLPSFLGTYLARHWLLPAIPETVLSMSQFTLSKDQLVMLVFAMVMLGASISMIKKRTPAVEVAHGKGKNLKLSFWGFVVGFVAGFVGAGGGFLIIPALVLLGGLSMSVAVPTSLFIIATNSLVAFAGDMIGGVEVNWLFLMASSLAAAGGLFVGVKLSRAFTPSGLKTTFGWFVLVMGGLIMARQLI